MISILAFVFVFCFYDFNLGFVVYEPHVHCVFKHELFASWVISPTQRLSLFATVRFAQNVILDDSVVVCPPESLQLPKRQR